MSEQSEYRYTLRRVLDPEVSASSRRLCLCWVMLNPSTADDTVDDPTIRRVKRFTADAGFSELVVVNLFALRATKPKHLLTHADPVGYPNEQTMLDAMRESHSLVYAWGSWTGLRKLLHPNPDRFAQVAGLRPYCLGKTASGAPRHPLYVRADQPLVPFR